MISSIPTMSMRQQEFLADFKRDLDSPLKKRIEKRVDVETTAKLNGRETSHT